MKYRNLVYCKHPNFDARAYLYELPIDVDVSEGDRLVVRDKRGLHNVTAFCDSWICTSKMTQILCEANGGYFPPARVVGTVSTVTVQQDLINPFNNEEGLAR